MFLHSLTTLFLLLFLFVSLDATLRTIIVQSIIRGPLCITKAQQPLKLACTKTVILSQVKLNGSTGPIHFNEYGKRKGIELEILNLRNNSFQKVSNDVSNMYVLLP